MEAEHHTEVKDYKLPDGRVIKVGAERFRASEILFNPSIVGTEYGGVHEVLANAIFKTDLGRVLFFFFFLFENFLLLNFFFLR